MKKQTCWNCKWFNGNGETCDYGEITNSKEEICDNFKEEKSFPEEM